MAMIFDSQVRLVPAWVEASKYLLAQKKDGFMARNLVLQISDPITLTPADRNLRDEVDSRLNNKKNPTRIETVAGTIFPQLMYSRFGRPEFYGRYLEAMKVGKKEKSWGTYAMRLVQRKLGDGSTINPLEVIIERLRRAKASRTAFQSAYEAGIIDPAIDLTDLDEANADIPTYDPATDRNLNRNMPCLSHLSFKLNHSQSVDLTAIYRYHYYGERALGNLIGLARLLNFVAIETDVAIGELTCISTHAFLDVDALGGSVSARKLLTDYTG